MKHFLYILYIAFSAALPARTLAEGGEGVPPCVKIAGEPTAAIYNRYNKEIRFLIPEDESSISQFRQVLVASYASPEGSYQHNETLSRQRAEEFRTYCSRLYGLTPDDRVFYMTCTALNKELTRCTQLTYLPDIRVHDLRHSHVSLCIELGYSIVLVARRIGDTVPVVMRTYAHLYPNKQQELVSKLEAIGSPTSNNDDSDLMSLG